MDLNMQNQILAELNAKASSDDRFKAMLLADPAAVLQSKGFPVPYGVHCKVVETQGKLFLAMKGRGLDIVIPMGC